jgi:alpha-glucosidase (family GH31 glycosyl hydrolase)
MTGLQAQVYDIQIGKGQKMQIEFCSDRIFRIKITTDKDFPVSLLEHYEIVKTDWKTTKVTQKQQGQQVIYTTATHQLSVNKSTGEITVRDANGNVVLKKVVFLPENDRLVKEFRTSINEKFGKHRDNGGIIGSEKSEEFEKLEVAEDERNSVLSISLNDDERFYGGGGTSREHIQHRGEILRMWATYQRTEIPQPFLMSSRGWGIFNNTTAKNFFDVGRFRKDQLMVYTLADGLDFYLLLGETMPEVLKLYTSVTGSNYLLPKWAYGLSFGNNMLENQFDVLDDALRFRAEEIPVDMMWIEPQWMGKYYDFSTQKTWDYKKFPGEPEWVKNAYPKSEWHALFVGRLHKLGYKLALWLCINHDLSIEEEDYLAEKTGKPQSGQEHWFPHLTRFIDQGVDGFKLDPGKTLDEHPDRNYYNGYTDKEMHNLNQVLLPKQMHRIFRNHKNIRSFHHYCGGWAGTQHWSASTSGDNGGGRNALFDQLNLGLSGYMNTTCDVMSDSNEMASLHMGLLLPWVQINSWFELLHPWYLPLHEKNIYRDYVHLRYSLLPYIYSTAIEGTQTGMPMVRAMPLVFPDDRNADDLIYQYMFGNNLLVGVFSDEIYLPKGQWINYWTGETVQGEARTLKLDIPDNRAGHLFVRSGAIIPFQPPMQYVGEKPLDTLIVKIFPQGNSDYTLYEDDGKTFQHEQGETAATRFECNQTGKSITFTVHPVSGHYEGMYLSRSYQLEMACPPYPAHVQIDGKAVGDWRYEQGKITVNLQQADVFKKKTVVVSLPT